VAGTASKEGTVGYGESYYTEAAVCRRGHVATGNTAEHEVPARCSKCGANVLTACASCGTRIRGWHVVPGVVGGSPYKPPEFCDSCGSPHPWASRQARLWELENLLEGEEISDADRLMIREQIEQLQNPDLDEREQAEHWTRIRKAAGAFKGPALAIFESVTTAAIKAHMGL
jgi:hypothetical protein